MSKKSFQTLYKSIFLFMFSLLILFSCKTKPDVVEEPEPSTTTTTSTTTSTTTTSTTTTTTIPFQLSEQEIEETKGLIDKATKAGAKQYDAEDLDKANQLFTEAKNEQSQEKLDEAKKFANKAYIETYKKKCDEKKIICDNLFEKAKEYKIIPENNEKCSEAKKSYDTANDLYKNEDYVTSFTNFCDCENFLKNMIKETVAREREQKNKIAYVKKLIKDANKLGAAQYASEELNFAIENLSQGESLLADHEYDESAEFVNTAEKNAIDAINKTKFALKELKRKKALEAIMNAGQAIENASQTDMGKEEGINGYKFQFNDAEAKDENLQNAPSVNKDISYRDLFNKAIEYVEKAKAAYKDEDYDMAIQYANIAKKIALSYNGDTLKCKYTVRLIPEKRDCLWRISEYSYIYNTPFLWPRIWKANKAKILNPDLIYPGQILDIPNID